jgi:succinate-semialdehyde dehydrogenase/glutarate-semialdehyde dehydrogenase
VEEGLAVRPLQGDAQGAELIRQRVDEIAPIMTMEQGKPVIEAKGETLLAADIIDWMAEEGRRTYGRIVPARLENVYQLVMKEPVGPVAAFTPWNFPINQVVRKASAAIATGCSIIVKGPEDTPARARSWSRRSSMPAFRRA